MLEKSKKKGGGVHWDIVLLCLINTICGLFGGPWICAATVRGVAHVSALTVMSTNHAPGEAPHIVEVKGNIHTWTNRSLKQFGFIFSNKSILIEI
jgi:hypothetical protein